MQKIKSKTQNLLTSCSCYLMGFAVLKACIQSFLLETKSIEKIFFSKVGIKFLPDDEGGVRFIQKLGGLYV